MSKQNPDKLLGRIKSLKMSPIEARLFAIRKEIESLSKEVGVRGHQKQRLLESLDDIMSTLYSYEQ